MDYRCRHSGHPVLPSGRLSVYSVWFYFVYSLMDSVYTDGANKCTPLFLSETGHAQFFLASNC